MALVEILITLSAFVMLYESCQARGYLHFLGTEAKRGTLKEEYCDSIGGQKRESRSRISRRPSLKARIDYLGQRRKDCHPSLTCYIAKRARTLFGNHKLFSVL
ncbi:MAG TPA: hypothetical protein DCP92_17355 [Nitrospiraceae bacterium]|nr:hypothetical protein [Nitrospiraceae bacterium]